MARGSEAAGMRDARTARARPEARAEARPESRAEARAAGRVAGALVLALALSGCARPGPPDLVRLRSEGPDEFAILPGKPLEAPPRLDALPPPIPGGPSRTDPTPLADATAALGGRPGARAAVPARDGAVVAHAGRGGIAPGVRGTLAAEDLAARERGSPRVLERIFGVDTYSDVYDRQALDPYEELDRFRRAGVRTPAAPPEGR